MSNREQEYVLGTGTDELERLGIQHRLWSDAAHAAWKRAGVRPGQSVLDVGCGPGYASFDLAMMVGRAGRVLGIDESSNFIAFLNAQAQSRHLPQLHGVVGDVQSMGSAAGIDQGAFDLAYARWVLCFVPRPEAVIAQMARALRPGGRVVLHDYFNYESMAMAPRRKAWEKVVAATAHSWRARGGDPDVMGRAPAMLKQAGLRVESVEVHQRVARAGESMFTWPETWWRIYTPKLVQMGLVTQAECDELMRDLDELANDPHQFMTCPPVFEVIATKA
jgi:ubiquinone/menaquinone biosynthesis C-methylase UbiE